MRNNMGENWAVEWEGLFINRSTAGEMNDFAWYMKFGSLLATWERMLLGSALPQGRVSISQKEWSINIYWSWQQTNWKVNWSLLSITNVLAASKANTPSNIVPTAVWKWAQLSVNEYWLCILGCPSVNLWKQFRYNVLPACSYRTIRDIFSAQYWNSTSTEHQRLLVC